MNLSSCSDPCLCNCRPQQTKTQIIIYPLPTHYNKSFQKIKHKSPTLQTYHSSHKTNTFHSEFKPYQFNHLQIVTDNQNKENQTPQIQIKQIQIKEIQIQRQPENQKTLKNFELNSPKSIFSSNLRSPSTVRESALTIRLLERENGQLKQELCRLKQEGKELKEFKNESKRRNNKELITINKKHEELQRKSVCRKQQLKQLSNLLLLAKKKMG